MKEDLLQWHRAALEAIETLYTMQDRLELNNIDGEEQPFIEDCQKALTLLEALPVNRQAVEAAK